jgi:nitroreductase
VPVGPDASVMAIMSTTRAMRYLAPDPVPDDLIRSIIEAATWAPSAGNLQVASFVVVTDRETIARIAVLWRRVIDDYRVLMDAAGLGDVSDPASARIVASVEYQRDHFTEIPALLVVCQGTDTVRGTPRSSSAAFRIVVRRVGLRRSLSLLRAWRHASGRSEGSSVFPAVQNLLLAARAHGLGACLTSWHLFAEDEFKEIVGIPKDVKTFAVIPVGWPLRRFGPVRRRPVDEVIHRERW